MTSLVQLKGVCKDYVNVRVLHEINLNLIQGTIFGLLGPNGAGKTSLIRILNGITQADEGELVWNESLQLNQTNVHVGYLPEERGLYKKMQVFEQLVYLAQLKGLSKHAATEKTNAWLNKLDILHWGKKRVEELSKGMQQKVQFISTVIHEPKLLILDEPFSGFDPINANLIKQEILALKKQGVTILLSTHNMSSVEELCDDIALIHQGKIILSGSVEEIKQQHRKQVFEFRFRGNLALFSQALWSAGEVLHFEETKQFAIARVKLNERFHFRDVLRGLLEKLDVVAFYEIYPTMNEIFIDHVTSHS